jgi:predicted  nucleic acid-binding Zn-ribbon protein
MEKVIKQLVDLQSIDNQLDKLRAKRGDLPERLKKLESQSTLILTNITDDKARIREINKDLKHLSAEIEDVKVQLEKYKNQLYLVTTNKEYDALQHEMDAIKETINTNENTIIESEDEKIELEEAVKRNSISSENIIRDLTKSKSDLENAMINTIDEERRLEPLREKLAASVDKALLFTYERFRKARRGRGIVRIHRDSCGSCFNQLPPQTAIEVKKMESLISCPNCGMLLYSEE